MRKPNKKRNPFAKQLRHFTSKVFKVKNKYDRKKLEKHSTGEVLKDKVRAKGSHK